MKEAVFQGRRVVNNIQRSSSLFVMKDFLWLFITIMPILLGIPHIIQPTVMTLVNVFITGFASLFIALDTDKTRVKGNFFRNVVDRAISSGFFMFIPVLAMMLYYIIASISRTGSFDIHMMKTAFEDGNITAIGWIPVLAICVTIAGFIVFFDECRPFTTFRKVLFSITLFVVLNVLYLMPEYFIVSGTEMLHETGGFVNIINYILKHMGANAVFKLYRTMTLEQLLFLVIYAAVAYPLFMLHKKFSGLIINKLFTPKDFRDE